MSYNYEFIDRIVIAAEKEIEGKTEVRVELVKVLISTLRDFNSKQVINQIAPEEDEQFNLSYD